MRAARSITASVVMLIVALCPAAAAQQRALIPLYQPTMDNALYWDHASVRRIGPDVEFDLLEVHTQSTGAAPKPITQITTYRMSCDWSTLAAPIRRERYDAAGNVTDTRDAEPMQRVGLVGTKAWYVPAAPMVCDPDYVAPADALPSVKHAIDHAAAILKPTHYEIVRPPPRGGPGAPFILPGYPKFAPYRFSVLRADQTTGDVLFFDWGNLRRKDGKASVLLLEVLGDNSPPPPAWQWPDAMIGLRSLEVDCGARTARAIGYQAWDKELRHAGRDADPWPVRSDRNWPIGALVIDAACTGKQPRQVFKSREAAVAFQRKLHPLKGAG